MRQCDHVVNRNNCSVIHPGGIKIKGLYDLVRRYEDACVRVKILCGVGKEGCHWLLFKIVYGSLYAMHLVCFVKN